MFFYGIFTVSVLIVTMWLLYNEMPFVVFVLVSMPILGLLSNFIAYVSLRRAWAEVFFVADAFTMLSVYDTLSGGHPKSFPIKFANPALLDKDRIQIHYLDQVVILKRSDWEDFDLIWVWLNEPHQ